VKSSAKSSDGAARQADAPRPEAPVAFPILDVIRRYQQKERKEKPNPSFASNSSNATYD
jgi:hypothetical protein